MTEQEKRRYIIETAIGLQAVDGLHVSDFFLQQSERYISDEITLKELGEIVRKYHENDDKKWMQGRRRVYKHWIFTYIVNSVGGVEPSIEAKKIIHLYATGEIDLDSAKKKLLKEYHS